MTQSQALQPQPRTYEDWLTAEVMPKAFEVLAKTIDQARFARIIFTQFQKNPKLARCTKPSLVAAIMDSARVGLEPDGTHAALVPYEVDGSVVAQFMPMYRGLIRKAREAGDVADIESAVIHEHDEFDHEKGLTQMLKHKPAPFGKRGKVVGYYAIARFHDGRTPMFEVMEQAEVDAIKARSRAKKGPWLTDPIEMGRKCPVRKLCKYLKLDADTHQIITEDERFDAAANAEVVDDGKEQRPKTLDALTAKLKEELEPKPEPVALKDLPEAPSWFPPAEEEDPFAEDKSVGVESVQDEPASGSSGLSALDPADPSAFKHRMRFGLMPSQGWEAWSTEQVWRGGMLKDYTPAQAILGSHKGKRHAALLSAVQYEQQKGNPKDPRQGAIFADYALAYLEERWAREQGA